MRPRGRVEVFRYSVHRLFTGIAISTAASVALIAAIFQRSHGWAYYVAALVGIGLLFTRGFVRARLRRPTNWLVVMDDHGLFVNIRSYLNYHLSPDDRTVVFVPYGEIRSARAVRERTEIPDPESRAGATMERRRNLVALELFADSSELRGAIADEIAREAPSEERWYGRSSRKVAHSPVELKSPTTLCIEWKVVPNATAFLRELAPLTTVAPPVVWSTSSVRLERMSRAEQEARLREMALSGSGMAALAIARRLYGLDLAQAMEFIKALERTDPRQLEPSRAASAGER